MQLVLGIISVGIVSAAHFGLINFFSFLRGGVGGEMFYHR